MNNAHLPGNQCSDLGRMILLLCVLAWTWFPSVVIVFWCLSVALPLKYLYWAYKAFNRVSQGDISRPRTALITGAHRLEALHAARILKKEGFQVIAVTSQHSLVTLSFYSICVDKLIQISCPRKNPRLYIRQLIRIFAEYEVNLFVPLSGPKEAETEAMAADSLRRLGVCTLAPSFDQIDYFLHLDRFYELVERMNMETVMYYTANDMEKISDLYRRGVIVINGCRFMAKSATPNGLHESRWLPMPRELADARRKYTSMISGGLWVVAKFTSGFQYVLTVVVKNNRVLASTVCREGQTLRAVRCREILQWAHTFFRRLHYSVSGTFTIRFLKTVPEGRRTTFLPVFCKPCHHLSILFLEGSMGVFTKFFSQEEPPADARAPFLDVVNHPDRPLCVYSIYQQLMELLLLWLQVRPVQFASDFLRTIELLVRGREVVFRLCDPLPALLWYFVLLPWRICVGIVTNGSTVGRIQFLTGRLQKSDHWSECFADEPGRNQDD